MSKLCVSGLCRGLDDDGHVAEEDVLISRPSTIQPLLRSGATKVPAFRSAWSGTLSNLSHRAGRMSSQILRQVKMGTADHSALAIAGCS